MNIETININIVVDVMKALSEGTLESNAYLIDDSEAGSKGQCTESLYTVCKPGDIVRWKVCPIDLQAGAYIDSVSFGDGHSSQSHDGISPLYNF